MKVDKLDKPGFQLTRDNDGHWYVIPFNMAKKWGKWVDSEDAEDGNVPGWAEEVGGSPSLVIFENFIVR